MSKKLSPWDIKILGSLIAFTGATVTIFVTPWFSFDPINVPKMFVMSIGAFPILFFVFRSQVFRTNKVFLLFSVAFVSLIITSMFASSVDKYQQLWGVWGRSTGLLTYLCFVFIMLGSCVYASYGDTSKILRNFEKVGYVITLYTSMQYLELDFINWSQKQMVATLGNINFMSSFLGLVSILFVFKIIGEKSTLSAKFFFLFLLFVNLTLILLSGSIQGIAVFLFGMSRPFTKLISLRYGKVTSAVSIATLFFLSIPIMLGLAGYGPLGSRIYQQTVSYRIDYWFAGWQMTLDNWRLGLGLDSYGDFYRAYRSQEAVLRTGPQRVSNTAHNIFLDVSSGSGVVAGVLFATILISPIVVAVVKSSKTSETRAHIDMEKLISLCLGFLVVCLISINQIGLGIWGFIFIGLLAGESFKLTNRELEVSKYHDKKLSLDSKSKLHKYNSEQLSAWEKLKLFSCSILGLVVALPPFVQDINFLDAKKDNNLVRLEQISRAFGATSFHRENLMQSYARLGRINDLTRIAKLEIEINNRNFSAWTYLAISEGVGVDLRKKAAKELIFLDPQNRGIASELAVLLNPELAKRP